MHSSYVSRYNGEIFFHKLLLFMLPKNRYEKQSKYPVLLLIIYINDNIIYYYNNFTYFSIIKVTLLITTIVIHALVF